MKKDLEKGNKPPPTEINIYAPITNYNYIKKEVNIYQELNKKEFIRKSVIKGDEDTPQKFDDIYFLQ
jgi:hypothetical protein